MFTTKDTKSVKRSQDESLNGFSNRTFVLFECFVVKSVFSAVSWYRTLGFGRR